MKNKIIQIICFDICLACLWLTGCAVAPRVPAKARMIPPPEILPQGVYCLPVEGSKIISNFGQRGRRFHEGIDLKKHRHGGDPVLAARDGMVEKVRYGGGYGLMVLLLHSDGSRTRYAHLRQKKVKKGQKVMAGEVIGTVGATGNATTPHLHFEIITRAKRTIDPKPYLFPEKTNITSNKKLIDED